MNDLLRPALYQAAHRDRVRERRSRNPNDHRGRRRARLRDRRLPSSRDVEIARPREGDLLAIRDAGAYGFAMSSNYNFRPRPAEVLVEGGMARLDPAAARRYEDLIRLEVV